jgi:hypothetical protein
MRIAAGRLIARKFGRLTRVLDEDYYRWLANAPAIGAADSERRESASMKAGRGATEAARAAIKGRAAQIAAVLDGRRGGSAR